MSFETKGMPAVPIPERLLYRLDEIAGLVGVSRRTIERQRSAGRFPPPPTCGSARRRSGSPRRFRSGSTPPAWPEAVVKADRTRLDRFDPTCENSSPATPGTLLRTSTMASVFKRLRDKKRQGASWYIAFTDETGRRRSLKGCPDKQATEAMARKLESDAELRRRGVVDPRTDAYAAHEARPLLGHLADFRAALVAKGNSLKHASMTHNRAARVLDKAQLKRISDFSASKALDGLARLRAEGLGQETINHHVRAVKGFARWLWKEGRARDHYLAHLATANPDADRRRPRRAMSNDEVVRLVRAAEAGRSAKGMTGPERARCYAVALGTGFRADELRSLTPERFQLDGDPPTATVPAGYTKNGREEVQPLPPALAARLRPWLATLPPGRPVFPLSDRAAEMMRVDLEAAGIPYETEEGVADFHSLRAVYVSNLVASGASVKVCQVLARHSTPTLTIGVYAKASLHDVAGAVAALPDPTGRPEVLAATGTDSGRILTAPGQRAPDGTSRGLSVPGGMNDAAPGSIADPGAALNLMSEAVLSGTCRLESGSVGDAGGGSRTHTGVAPRRILSPLRLPFRHAGIIYRCD